MRTCVLIVKFNDKRIFYLYLKFYLTLFQIRAKIFKMKKKRNLRFYFQGAGRKELREMQRKEVRI